MKKPGFLIPRDRTYPRNRVFTITFASHKIFRKKPGFLIYAIAITKKSNKQKPVRSHLIPATYHP
ncbi:hypothetical protein QUA82_20800 [Microcoleus sp. F8-D3]